MNTDTPSVPPVRKLLGIAGEVLLLVWIVGIFWYYYDVRGFFDLVRTLWAGAS